MESVEGPPRPSYRAAMEAYPAHIILKLDTNEPIELGDFVGAFTSLANEFERFMKAEHPDLAATAQIYVREVKAGCIAADLVPWLAVAAPFIAEMDKILIVEDFVRRWGMRFTALVTGHRESQPETKNELKDWADAVAAIANDPNGSSTLSAATFEGGEPQIRVAFHFDTKDAAKARDVIGERKKELDRKTGGTHERVLMFFTRSDVNDATMGRPSGERVTIEAISPQSLPLMYASELAEARIKHEIRETRIYKKGFVVDVAVQTRDGKAVAYAVTNLHQVIDMDDE